ncbi:MAG: MBL fold metallo-hydrolase [Anaerolineales bacterium]|jgi:flavorubredoxin
METHLDAQPTVMLAPDVEWINECYPTQGRHEHVSVYLIRTDSKYIIIDSGSYYHRTSIRARILEATGQQGIGAIILSHADYPHAANVNAFRRQWGDIDVIASSGVPELQGLPFAQKSKIGGSLEVFGRKFSFIDPPLADRSHTSWIYDHGSGFLFTADGMGNYHQPGQCGLTFGEFSGGVPLTDIYDFHRTALVWLRYVDPARLRARLESIYAQFSISYIAPIHGNPIAGKDLDTFMDRMIEAASRISSEYAVTD